MTDSSRMHEREKEPLLELIKCYSCDILETPLASPQPPITCLQSTGIDDVIVAQSHISFIILNNCFLQTVCLI